MANMVEWAKAHVVTAVSIGLVTVLFFAGLIAPGSVAPRVSLVLANTVGMNFYIWNFFSAGFFETNVIKAVADVVWLLSAGRLLEEAMGLEGFALFVVIVNGINGLVTSMGLFSLYVITRLEQVLFMDTYGFGGLVAALAVGLKQHMPEEAPIPTVPSLRCKHLPLLLGVLSVAMWTVGVSSWSKDAPFVVTGIYASWWYLRFVHRNPDGSHGDVSEDFAFVTLFPPPMRRYLSPVAEFTYGVGLLLGYFKGRRPPTPAAPADEGMPLHAPPPPVHDPVAERRRAKAREQLDAKLAAMAAQDENWGDEDELEA